MRTHLKLPALAVVAVLLISACSSGAATSAPSSGASAAPPASTAPSTAASPSAAAAAPTPEPAKACAQGTDPNAMQMCERSGGNKIIVDQLVYDWNAANADKPFFFNDTATTE